MQTKIYTASTKHKFIRVFDVQCLQRVSEKMDLRHPNIISVLGVSYEPGRSDILKVTAYMENGSLYEWLHNLTVSLEPELVLSMVRVS